jgi:hypothetical protein
VVWLVWNWAGEKLIDHLKKWLEPEKLLTVPHSWEAGQECHIAAAILDLFHLLPPPAVKFLESGVSNTKPFLHGRHTCIHAAMLLHVLRLHVRFSGTLGMSWHDHFCLLAGASRTGGVDDRAGKCSRPAAHEHRAHQDVVTL